MTGAGWGKGGGGGGGASEGFFWSEFLVKKDFFESIEDSAIFFGCKK